MRYVWISEHDEYVGCSLYRSFTVHRHLINHGIPATCWIGFDPTCWWQTSPPTTPWTDIPGSTTIVQRIPMTDANQHHFDRIAREAASYGYDLDDMVWDHGVLPEGAMYTEGQSIGVLRAVEWAQFVTVSTARLGAEVEARWPHKKVYVVENKISGQDARQAQTYRPFRESSRVNIGYASGTATHRRDFDMILPVLDRIMDSRPYVDLHIIGELPLRGEFEQKWYSRHRLKKWPHMRPQVLPLFISSLFDINLNPLEDTRFNRCKSLAKFIEAGIFGVPSVVSPTGILMDLSDDVCLKADTDSDWERHILRLVDRPQERRFLGDLTQTYVLENYTILTRPDLGGLL